MLPFQGEWDWSDVFPARWAGLWYACLSGREEESRQVGPVGRVGHVRQVGRKKPQPGADSARSTSSGQTGSPCAGVLHFNPIGRLSPFGWDKGAAALLTFTAGGGGKSFEC